MGEHRLAPGVVVGSDVIRWSFSSSPGPGGQNVNKKATKAELRIRVADLGLHPRAEERLRRLAGARLVAGERSGAPDPPPGRDDEILITSSEHRSQGRNKSECLERLEELVSAAAARPKVRRPTRPTRSSVARRLDEKKSTSRLKRGRAAGGGRGDE